MPWLPAPKLSCRRDRFRRWRCERIVGWERLSSYLAEMVLILPTRRASRARQLGDRPIDLLICATGILTVEGKAPEKSLRQLDPNVMMAQFLINAGGPALLAKYFLPRLDRQERSIAAFLSARVGSIGDNRLGGWISYRSAKAALNQIVRTASIEFARTHPQALVVSIHPGTVRTRLSEPYAMGAPDGQSSRSCGVDPDCCRFDGTRKNRLICVYDGSTILW